MDILQLRIYCAALFMSHRRAYKPLLSLDGISLLPGAIVLRFCIQTKAYKKVQKMQTIRVHRVNI